MKTDNTQTNIYSKKPIKQLIISIENAASYHKRNKE